jgi:C4-dicarboxylate-specific signal transduction histidine kinase
MKNNKLKSILYLEDDKMIQKELINILECFCEDLYIADDGVEGLEYYEKHDPQLIISDIQMPNMDGIEFAKKVKEDNKNKKIIFITAFSDTKYLKDAIDLQVSGYILKPLNVQVLIQKVEEIAQEFAIKEELEHKNKLLLQQSKLSSLGEMIGNIAHQWRQPLALIVGSVNNVHLKLKLEKFDLNKEDERELFLSFLDKKLHSISDHCEYLSKTIDTFREFIVGSNLEDHFTVQTLIEESIFIIRDSLNANYITLEDNLFDSPNKDIELFAPKNQLVQVLVNVINNAKDILTEKKIETPWIKIDTNEVDESIVISVEDNGGGIPEDILPNIFEPYFTTKHKDQGTGLGLYMSYKIIESLGGKIWAQNSSHGAQFFIEIVKARR